MSILYVIYFTMDVILKAVHPSFGIRAALLRAGGRRQRLALEEPVPGVRRDRDDGRHERDRGKVESRALLGAVLCAADLGRALCHYRVDVDATPILGRHVDRRGDVEALAQLMGANIIALNARVS